MRTGTHMMLLAAGMLLAGNALASQELPAQPKHAPPEAQLVQALTQIRQGDYNRALAGLSSLIETQPNFRLAQYVYGQLMVARTGNAIDPSLRKKLQNIRVAMVNEVRTRWTHSRHMDAHYNKVPAAIIKLAPKHDYAVVVDLSNNRLYLFANDNGLPRLIGDFYATIGSNGAGKRVAGDKRTPIGVYSITTFRSGNTLPGLYGTGAFPLNYPNPLDERRGRTGYGIWLHGVPQSTYARAPRASAGCVAIANNVFQWLREYVDPGQTPVIMAHTVQWLTQDEARARREAIMARLKGWIDSWEAINTKQYLSYYADDFSTFDGTGKQAFAENKYAVNAHKTSINVDISQLSIFRYPGTDNGAMLKLSFHQDYASSNFDWAGAKVQFWRRHAADDPWRITLERSHG